MKHILFALILIFAPPPQIVASAFSDDAVMLREDIRVEDNVVTLGDLFGVAGETADVVVARAPEPGRRTSLDPDYIRQTAQTHGLAWSNPNRLRRVTVERASRMIDSDLVREMISAELNMRDGNEYDVQLSGAGAVHMPLDARGLPEISTMDFSARTGVFQAELIAYEGASPVRLSGRAYATLDVPVLARPVAAGQRLDHGDIDWMAVRADRVRADAVMNPDNMIGMETRRALRPGEPVRAYDLQAPVVVARGETVNLVFSVPGLTLTARARALEDAGENEIIRFVNLQSNRTIDAMVEGPGRARVVTAGPS
jgi:flagellar basal body P-ring formation protein FlgA